MHLIGAIISQATSPTAPDWTWLTQGGAVGTLAFIVVAFLRGWIVPGSAYKQVREERDRALETVYRAAEVAQRALDLSEKGKA